MILIFCLQNGFKNLVSQRVALFSNDYSSDYAESDQKGNINNNNNNNNNNKPNNNNNNNKTGMKDTNNSSNTDPLNLEISAQKSGRNKAG